jgi:hypothetical protein
MESQLRHTEDTISHKRRSMAGLQQEIEVQEANGKTPRRSFFGRVLAAVGGGPQDPRAVLEKLQSEVVALERLRQALHAGESERQVDAWVESRDGAPAVQYSELLADRLGTS